MIDDMAGAWGHLITEEWVSHGLSSPVWNRGRWYDPVTTINEWW
jgi:hypothetical protein